MANNNGRGIGSMDPKHESGKAHEGKNAGRHGSKGNHHHAAAFHHETAAHHHREAAKHTVAGNHGDAKRHADAAHTHGTAAREHGENAREDEGRAGADDRDDAFRGDDAQQQARGGRGYDDDRGQGERTARGYDDQNNGVTEGGRRSHGRQDESTSVRNENPDERGDGQDDQRGRRAGARSQSAQQGNGHSQKHP